MKTGLVDTFYTAKLLGTLVAGQLDVGQLVTRRFPSWPGTAA
ncbi:hypothetical protein [Actinoplanes sp. NBRC 103695]|nr:hypothetical protein [Actinoplanes sp. NBRC 103695]